MYWVNGILSEVISLSNRALQFGDGFFTTAKLNNGKIVFFNRHLDRLLVSAKKLMFNNINIDLIRQEMQEAAVIEMNGFIKIIISRKNYDNKMYGYRYTNDVEISRIICTGKLPDYYFQWLRYGIKIKTSIIRLSRNCLLAGIKHLNRLEQVIIAQWICKDSSIDEALVLDTEDNIIECCSSNIFWRKNNEVFTPSVYYAGVRGVIRNLVLELLPKLGYLSKEIMVNPEHLKDADEVFITNSLLPVVSVNKVDDFCYRNKTLSTLLNSYLNNKYY